MNNESILKLQELHQSSQEMGEQLKVVEQQISELRQFSSNLEDLEKNNSKEILASFGKGVYLKSESKGEKLFVDVGAGILIRKSYGETKKVIEDQTVKLNEIKVQLLAQNDLIQGQMKGLIGEFEKAK